MGCTKYITFNEAYILMRNHDWKTFIVSKSKWMWYKNKWLSVWDWNNVDWRGNYAIGKLYFIRMKDN